MAPSRPCEPRVLVILATIAVILSACAVPPPTVEATPPASTTPVAVSTPKATPSPELTPQATPEQTGAASPSADPNSFVSQYYNYALTLPPGTALIRWRAATRQWDGVTQVPEEGPYIDRSTVAEGGLLIVGSPADSLDEFFTRFEATGPRYHGCNAAENRVDATINGVPAIGFTQACGSREGFARLALYKDGLGIGASINTLAERAVAARDRLIELLAGLEWRPG